MRPLVWLLNQIKVLVGAYNPKKSNKKREKEHTEAKVIRIDKDKVKDIRYWEYFQLNRSVKKLDLVTSS